MFPDSSISLVKVNLKVESVLMLYFHLYNYAIQNNLVSESYDATWSCPRVLDFSWHRNNIEASILCSTLVSPSFLGEG